MFPYNAGQGGGKLPEAVGERWRKQIDIVGPAVMAYIPDHLNAVTLGCLQHGKKRREVVLSAAAVDEMPVEGPYSRFRTQDRSRIEPTFLSATEALADADVVVASCVVFTSCVVVVVFIVFLFSW